MKFAGAILLIFTTISVGFAQESNTFDWNQWALNNSGQIQYKETGEIFVEKIAGKENMDIGMPSLATIQELAQKDREVVVAVIDRGIDMQHPKFKDRLFKGIDFLDSSPMSDDNGHGTHVAGIIAANPNGSSIRGVTPKNVKILPLKVLSDDINGFIYTRTEGNKKRHIVITDIIADAINYATDAKVDVINMSLGWPQTINTPRVVEALNNAAEAGITLVAASGNNNKNVPLWPCAHKAVICVGSMNNQGEISEFSNHGAKVDLVTSGEWIVSTIPQNIESRTLRIQGQDAKNGSSQAAPFVSAAAALLKLKYPSISADEIKATLFNSAEKISIRQDGPTSKFVRYGRLDINKALELGPSKLFNVNVKDLSSVKVSSNGYFEFTLPLDFFGNISKDNLSVSIDGLEQHTINVRADEAIISGYINDLSKDSEKDIVIHATSESIKTSTPLTLTFSKKLDENTRYSSEISNLPANQILRINGSQKRHAVGIVSEEDIKDVDFIGYTTSTNRSTGIISVNILKANIDDDKVVTKTYNLENHSQFLAVFKKDINSDGKADYMFYGMSKDRRNLLFTFFNQDGSPLFNNFSTWTLPISGFGGLPLKEKEKSDFSWIKTDSFLGEILVPYFKKSWLVPDEDNGKDLLDFETGKGEHFYYLQPSIEGQDVIVKQRIFDSVSVNQEISQQLNLHSETRFVIENTIPQTLEESLSGTNRHMVSVGSDFYREYFILKTNKVGTFEIKPHSNQDPFQIQNMFIESLRYSDAQTSKSSFQFALLDRSKARVSNFSEEDAAKSFKLETSGWSNPFFQIISSFQENGKKTLFFESRYNVYAYEKDEYDNEYKVSKLPVNRDSSFPGVEFSETLQPVLIGTESQNLPGIGVDSTLIYGDRLYTMVKKSSEFMRPIALSIEVPSNCIPLKNRFLAATKKVSSYVLLCQSDNNKAFLRFVPLEL